MFATSLPTNSGNTPHSRPGAPTNVFSIYGLKSLRRGQFSEHFWRDINDRINAAPELVTMLAAGYLPEMTGGGCIAWRKVLRDCSCIDITYYAGDIGGEAEAPVWSATRYISTDIRRFEKIDGCLADVTLNQALGFENTLPEWTGPSGHDSYASAGQGGFANAV